MVARLHAIARETQYVADTHRRRSEDVPLDGDAVLVATGNLHDRGVAHAGEEGTDGHARHVTVGATAIGRIDGIHITIEHVRAAVDILRISRVRRVELGGHGEVPGAQHALEASRGGMTGTDGQGITRNRLVLEDHGVSPTRWRTTRSQDDFPSSRRSTATCTLCNDCMPPGIRAAPATACTHTHLISGRTSQ